MNKAKRNELEETPNAGWANWALLKAAQEEIKTKKITGPLALLTDRFELLLGDNEPNPHSILLSTNYGHWARGTTLEQAVTNLAKRAGRSEKVFLQYVLGDATAEVNEYGRLIVDSPAKIIAIGVVGTVGNMITVNKK